MKNILSNLTGIFAIFHPPLPSLPETQEPLNQQGTSLPTPLSWERFMVLLDAQVQSQTMAVREARNLSTSLKPEDLDIVLREIRSAQRSALSGLEFERALVEQEPLEGRPE
jgi:hypothetical protein